MSMESPVQADVASTHTDGLGVNKLDSWVLGYLGALCWWFKTYYIFAGLSLVGAVAAPVLGVVVPRQTDGTPYPSVVTLIIVAASVAATCIVGDKVADRWESRTTARELQRRDDNESLALLQAAESYQQSSNELNSLLETALRLPFLKPAIRKEQMETLRHAVVRAVAYAVGPGTRATYYALGFDSEGRRLVDPKHCLTIGRSDRPEREWVESENPGHEIWALLNRSDSEPQIVRFGEDAAGLEWDRVAYKCFVSIPVRAKTVTFGLLSVNAADVGAIQETERAVFLTAARILALMEASQLGHDAARRLLEMSDPTVKIQTQEDEEDEDDDSGDDAGSDS